MLGRYWRGTKEARQRRAPRLALQRKSGACLQSGAGRLGRLFRHRSKTLGGATAQTHAKVLPCSACLLKGHPLATKWAAEAAAPLEPDAMTLRCSVRGWGGPAGDPRWMAFGRAEGSGRGRLALLLFTLDGIGRSGETGPSIKGSCCVFGVIKTQHEGVSGDFTGEFEGRFF